VGRLLDGGGFTGIDANLGMFLDGGGFTGSNADLDMFLGSGCIVVVMANYEGAGSPVDAGGAELLGRVE
jgi:hypothetical protein